MLWQAIKKLFSTWDVQCARQRPTIGLDHVLTIFVCLLSLFYYIVVCDF